MNRKHILPGIALLILMTLISACAPAAVTTDEPTDEPQAETDEPTEEVTETEEATNTPKPTNTPRPTNTPKPTATEEPTETEAAATASGATATTNPGGQATDAPVELVPAGESVWVLDTTASETGSAAECPAPFYADFYGLVRIQTIDNGITWMRAQDGITYTLTKQPSPNTYWGTGASVYPGYTLTITVVFTSPTGLGATFVLIDQAIEGCNHYWKYGGALR